MSLASHHLFPTSRLTLYFNVTLNNHNHNHNHLSLLAPLIKSRHLIHISHTNPFHITKPYNHFLKPLNAHDDAGLKPQARDSFDVDSLLSVCELVCLVSSTVIATGFVVSNLIVGWSKAAFVGLVGKRVLVCGVLGLVCGVWIGSVLRRRQWWRICSENARGGGSVNLVERIEKLEEDSRSYATIIRVLSRQLEKLGIRFRLTRRALKEPISQTATLAQKNSEATRTLAMQEEVLEKELGEIQKVLLAMQSVIRKLGAIEKVLLAMEEQQEKQLDLILAIGKTGKLLESRREPSQEQDILDKSNLVDGAKQTETPHKTQAFGSSKGSNNDRV